MNWKRGVLLILWLLFLAGCSRGTTNSADGPSTPEAELVEEATPSAFLEEPPQPQGPLTLRVWLTSEFDPASGTDAGDLLRARLEEFGLLHPGLRIEVRIKAASGPGGIVDSLEATQAVAAGALPDLVLVPRPEMELAVSKGLLFPFDSFEFMQADSDWYRFAEQIARYDSKIYGVPFANDALVLLYRTSVVGTPPKDWTTTRRLVFPLAFPAGSDQQLFTLALYQAAGGKTRNDQGRPAIVPATLAAVFKLYQDGLDNGVFQPRMATYASEEDTRRALASRRADLAVAWISNFLQNPIEDIDATALPTAGSVPFTYVNGWVWALSNPNSDHQGTSAELAQFMSESAFMARWTAAAGYLPARPSALESWPELPARPLVSRIVLTGRLIPDRDLLNTLGPAIKQSTVELLRGDLEPVEAADAVAIRLGAP